MKFYDIDGVELTEWRVTGLVAGQDSAVMIIGVDVPQDADFTMTVDERVSVMARLHGTSDPFVDIAEVPIDLRAMTETDFGVAYFDVKLRADADVEGFDRVALTPGTVSNSPAGWRG